MIEHDPTIQTSPVPEFDAVIALGKNWRLPITGEEQIFLSTESKMTALAGAQMVAEGRARKLILSTGKTAGQDKNGNDYPPEADEMFKFLRKSYSEVQVPAEHVILQNTSFDTAGDAEEDRKIVDNLGFDRLALVTVKPHTRRASRLFKNHGVNITETIASQDLIKKRSKHHKRLVDKYYRSKKFLKEIIVESIGTVLVYTVDPKGDKIVRRMSKKTRSRD